jgi:murein DD-endopeptidase MepM/ murein hydrolase activator NlpD
MRAAALLMALTACATLPKQPGLPAVGPLEAGVTDPPGTWHPVLRGETLWRIAHHYGVTVNDLIKTNAIGDPTSLDAGRRIFVPLPPGSDLDERKARAEHRPRLLQAPAGPDIAPPGGFIFPLQGGKVIAWFGRRGDIVSDGINIAAPAGTSVRAVAAGKVVFAADDPGWGELVIVAHSGDWVSIYAHNQKRLVEEGQAVAQGESLALVGARGRVRKPQLHFELRRGVTPRDPASFLPARRDLQRR